MTTGIPNQVDDITADWLNDRLGDGFGTIAAVEMEHIGEGIGILGEVGRLKLSYVDGESGPATLIAKCQSLHPENVGLSSVMGFYLREVSVYQSLANEFPIATPACHVAEVAEGGAPFVLILEEVTGTRMIDQIEGATLEDTKLVAATVAALHAHYWDNEQLEQLAWLPPMNNPLYQGAASMIAANWDQFVTTWADKVPADVLDRCPEMTDRYLELLAWLDQTRPKTFCHIDCRAENYLFDAPGAPITVVDFQLSVQHIGTFDLAYFLGMSVTIENRRAWEQEVLQHYHAALVAGGVTDYSFEQCWDDYRFCLFQQAWSQVINANVDPGNERGRVLLNEFVTRSFQASSDNRGYEVLDQF